MIDTTSPPEEITKHAKEWIKYVKGKKAVTEKSVSSIELWDFAGQQLYYASHPVFLTSRAIYILVCNLSKSLHDTAKHLCETRKSQLLVGQPKWCNKFGESAVLAVHRA